jgi:hypothetical protein
VETLKRPARLQERRERRKEQPVLRQLATNMSRALPGQTSEHPFFLLFSAMTAKEFSDVPK